MVTGVRMNYMLNDLQIEALIKLEQKQMERETRYNHLYYNDIKQTHKPALACNLLCVLGKFLIHTGEKLHEIAGQNTGLQQSNTQKLMPKAG